MKIPKYPLFFWVSPKINDNTYAFQVRVYKTHRQLLKDYRKSSQCRRRKSTPLAFFRPAEGMTFVKTGEFDKGASGQIVFSRDMLSTGTIAHECLHAGLHYMKRLKRCAFSARKRKMPANEEMLAMAVDTMTEQIVRRLNKEL